MSQEDSKPVEAGGTESARPAGGPWDQPGGHDGTDLGQLGRRPRGPGRFQFSVAEMLAGVVVLAVVLGLLVLLQPAYAAGAAGLCVLAGLLVVLVLGSRRPVVVVIWWGLVAIYVIFAVIAVFR